jgi:hypothetical protein
MSDVPHWVEIETRRVAARFVERLARSHKWGAIYLITPWISCFGIEMGMTFGQFVKRLRDDDATLYLVTRTPTEPWHWAAVKQLADSKQANIRLVDPLHTKLLCALTAQGDFALMGSANLTTRSLSNRELGLFLTATGDGRQLVKRLREEAAEVYRSPGKLYCNRTFQGRS